jgi:hypothetical protein
VGVLEVHALADAAQLDLLVAGDDLEGDLAAGVADGLINLSEPAAAGGALDGEPLQRAVPVLVLELPHDLRPCFPGVSGVVFYVCDTVVRQNAAKATPA